MTKTFNYITVPTSGRYNGVIKKGKTTGGPMPNVFIVQLWRLSN
jgi:hypothetical protein